MTAGFARSGSRTALVALPAFRPHIERFALRIALVALASTIAAIGVALWMWAGQRFAPPPVSFMTGPLPIATQLPMALAYSTVGTILAARRPGNPIGWLFLLVGATCGVVPAIDLLVGASAHGFAAAPFTTSVLAWAVSSFHLPLVGASIIVVFIRFPEGHAPVRPWHHASWLAPLAAVAVGFGLAINPDGLVWYPTLANPFAAPDWARPISLGFQAVGLGLMLLALVLASVGMVRRYRSYTPEGRHRLVWIIGAMGLLGLTGGLLLVVRYGAPVDTRLGELVLVATLISAALVPIAAAAGILRHQLFGIALLLNHALVYVPLMALLSGLYAASVALFQKVFVAATGNTSDVAIVLSTLILASMFTPLRKSLEGFVERRFKPIEVAAELADAQDPEDAGVPDAPMAMAAATPVPAAAAVAFAGPLANDEIEQLRMRLARLEEALAPISAPEAG
jgi:hypothetical protein